MCFGDDKLKSVAKDLVEVRYEQDVTFFIIDKSLCASIISLSF